MARARTVAALAWVLAAGCVPSVEGNEARDAHKVLPASFGAQDHAPTATSVAQEKWDRFFRSPNLRRLIHEAMRNNQELNIELQALLGARAAAAPRQGEYLPKLGAAAGVGVEKVGKHTSQGVSDDAHGVPEHLGDFRFGLVGSWEIDVWGKLRDAAKAADYRYRASLEVRNFMVTQIVAEIAASYYELVALDRQRDILRKNIDVQKDALEVVRLEKQAARVTELAVQRFEAEVLRNEARLWDVDQRRVEAENRINFLVGRYPQPVARDPAELDMAFPEEVDVGVPSALLENRPDVRAAELEMEAAKLDVSAARKAFFPSLAVDATLGYRSFNPEHLVATPESLFYGLAGGVTMPLLNRAAISARYRSANARQIAAVLRYEQTLLEAFTDVATQLAKIQNLSKSYELQARQVATLASAVDVSGTLFVSARADYMEVLLTRRDSLEAQMALVETRGAQLEAIVKLYRALGGGWRGDG
jgi:multidrug efflux system outer membrane protein